MKRLLLFLSTVVFINDAVSKYVFEDFGEINIIKPSDCAKIPNTVFVKCRSSTQPTCKEPRPMYQTHDCSDYCACASAYILNDENKCIRHEECPENAACIAQDPNSEYRNRCGTRITCNNYNLKDLTIPDRPEFIDFFVPTICENRCECKPGFVFDETSQKCVQPTMCPK